MLLGVSRKSFIDKIFPAHVNERLEGTIAANTIGIMNGANIIRVHDVLENVKAARVTDKIFNITIDKIRENIGKYINQIQNASGIKRKFLNLILSE